MHAHGLLERFEQAFGDHLRAHLHREVLGDHDELVTAEPPERVGRPHHAVEARGELAQQLVAGLVPERVVDALEVVDVDEQRSHRRLVPTSSGERLLAAVQDQRAVGQPRERVVCRHERELGVGLLALRLEALAHAHERHVDGELDHRQPRAAPPRRRCRCPRRTRAEPRRSCRASAGCAWRRRSARRCAGLRAGRRSRRLYGSSRGPPPGCRPPSSSPTPRSRSSRSARNARAGPG